MTASNASRHAARFCLKSLACLLVLAAAQPAIAQPTTPKDDADKSAAAARADELARQGAKAAAEGDLGAAREKLAQAFALKPAYDIAGNLGGVEYGLGRYREAAEHLSFSLRTYPVTGNQDQRAQTEAFLNKARTKLCAITLQGLPSNASVLIDGSRTAVPDKPPLYLEPGPHTLSLSALGYQDMRNQYVCIAGDSTTLRIEMNREKAAEPSKTSEDAGTGAREADGGAPLWPVVVGSSLTLAAVGAGTGVWFLRRDAEGNAEEILNRLVTTTGITNPCYAVASNPHQDDCQKLRSSRNREGIFENVSFAAFITGGAAAVATLGYLVGYSVSLGPKDESDQVTAANVHFTPSSVMLDVSF